MKGLAVILLAVITAEVAARHRKEWQRIDPARAARERFQPLYKSEACARGAGFYRDPQDCHQYIRCVDEFGGGTHFSIFAGRCEPGLVFDEKISACNWPELSAPCSNSPEKIQVVRNPDGSGFPEQENIIPQEQEREKPYPVQQQVVQVPQESGAYKPQQQEAWQVQVVHPQGESDSHETEVTWQQVFQTTPAHAYDQQQKEVSWQDQDQIQQQQQEQAQYPINQQREHAQPPINQQQQQEQSQFPTNEQREHVQSPISQQQQQEQAQFPTNAQQEQAQHPPNQWQQSEQNTGFQESVEDKQQQQQVKVEKPAYGSQGKKNPNPQQRPSGAFQEIEDNPQLDVSANAQHGQVEQAQESQSKWWFPENSAQHKPPGDAAQVPASDTGEEPVFCEKEGFYRHPDNCNQFIRCVKLGLTYSVHIFECPKQTVFSEKDSACTADDQRSCRVVVRQKRQAAPGGQLKCRGEGFFRHPKDCRAFYRCVKTESGSYETHMFSCPANLVFDEEYTTCNWPEKAPPCNSPGQLVQRRGKPPQDETPYKPRTTQKPRNDFLDKTITKETIETRRTSKPRPTPSKPKPTSSYDSSPKCRSQGFFGNKRDCTKFFKCVMRGNRFVRYELSCPNNYGFDDRAKRCVAQKYLTSCSSDRPPYPPPRQADEETTASPETTSPAASSASPSDDIVCEKEGYFRHPEDCNKFYRCVDFSGEGQEFVRYDFDCPEGLVFDESNSVCNWPDPTAPCEARGGGGQDGTEGTDQGGNEGTDQGGNEGTDQGGNEGTDQGGNEGTDQGGNEGTEEGGDEGSVGEGSEDGGAGESEATNEPGSEDQDGSSSAPGEESSPEPTESPPEESVSEGQGGDGNESGGGGSGGECAQEGFYRNPEDCNKFYRCVDFDGEGKEFVRYDFACPEGLVFDEANSVCNWPADSEPCDATSSGGSGGDGSGGQGSTTSGAEDGSQPGGGQEGSSTTSDESGQEGSSTTSGESGQGSSDDDAPVTDGSTSGSTTESSSVDDSSDQQEGSSQAPEPTPGTGDQGGSGNSGECTEAGFFRNPEDCNKFYRCVDQNGDGKEFTRYDFTCPEGLVFDETNSVCNWPDQSAPCEGGGGSPEGGSTSGDGSGSSTTPEGGEGSQTTPGSGGTSQTTAGGDDTSSEPPVGESSTESTGSDENTESGGGGSDSSSTTVGSENTPSEGGEGGSTSDSSGGGGGPSENTGECTEEGFFRNPEDCNKFYRCVDFNGDGQQFVRYDFDCPEGLVFDEVNSVCNWPEQSPGCESGGGPGSNGTTSGEGTSSQTESSTTESAGSTDQSAGSTTQQSTQSTAEQSTQATTGSSSQTTTQSSTTQESTDQSSTQQSTSESPASGDSSCSQEGFFRCEDDCSKFYRCVEQDGRLTRYNFSCPDGLIFDDQNQKCDLPSDVLTCDAGSTTGTDSSSGAPGESTSGSDSTSPATESTTAASTSGSATARETAQPSSTTQSSTASSGSSSSEECSEEGYFRNPDDCSKYYRCIDEGDGTFTREDYACAEDEVFDEEMRYCNRKDLAPPCDSSETSSSSSSTTASSESASSEAQSTAESTTQSTSDGSTTSSGTFECTQPGFFRCPEDCTKFYRCVENKDTGDIKRYDFYCPDELIFDEKNQKCDYPSSELTCDEEGNTSTTQSATSDSQTTSESSSGTSGATTSSSSDSTTSAGTTSGGTSTEGCTEEGYFRNPEDCSKYYRCIDEGDGTLTREDFACEEDEVFDEEMNYCNRRDLAPPCDDSSSSTTGSSAGSTESSSGQSTTGSSQQGTESTTASSGSESTSGSETTASSESSSQGSGDCQEEGFHRDPNDCGKFYRCVDFQGDGQSFTRYDFDCPDGLVFDESNDVCNWPSSVPSCESSGSGNEGGSTSSGEPGSTTVGDSSSTVGDSSSTAGDSSSTVGDSSSTVGDSSSTVGDSSSTVGDSSSTAGDSSSASTSGDQTTSTSVDQSSTTSSDGSTSPTSTGTAGGSESTTSSPGSGSTSSESTSESTRGSSSDIECTEEGFFRHPDDCAKFYRCVDFAGTGESYVRYDFECGEGTVFDEVNSVCNWPNQSPRCESRSGGGRDTGSSGSTTGGGTGGESGTESGQTTSTTPSDQSTSGSGTGGDSTTSSGDTFRCEEEGYFKHPTDCRKYYECKRDEDTGELVRIDCECPDGHVWDNEGWYCNAAELSPPCEGDGGSTDGSTDGSTSGSTFRCTEEGFFRDPEDCTRYYRCNRTGENEFRSERFQCDDGLVFDEEGKYCNAPELSEPCDGSSSTTQGGASTTGSGTSDSSSSGPGGSDSSTSGPGGSESSTSGPGGSESSTSGPGGSESSTSGSESGNSGECTREGFFRNPEDCTKYYRCSMNEDTGEFDRSDYSCPDGRIFDEQSNYCNDPELSEEPCDTGSEGSSTTTQQSTSGTSSGSGDTRGGSGGPECTQEGFYRHPDDCNKFYRCVDFKGTGESYVRFDFDCPEGLHFDEVNSVCNWPTMTPPCQSGDQLLRRYLGRIN